MNEANNHKGNSRRKNRERFVPDDVIAFHVILGVYGFWLPNDPRGSKSHFVWADNLKQFGDATYVETNNSVAATKHDSNFRKRAKRALIYPAVQLNGHQANAIGDGFNDAVKKCDIHIVACSILPEHTHLVLMRSAKSIEWTVAQLKRRSGWKLRESGLHPMEQHRTPDGRVHSVWGREFWVVYITEQNHLEAALRYVENNPLKEGKKRQNWSFVRCFDAED